MAGGNDERPSPGNPGGADETTTSWDGSAWLGDGQAYPAQQHPGGHHPQQQHPDQPFPDQRYPYQQYADQQYAPQQYPDQYFAGRGYPDAGPDHPGGYGAVFPGAPAGSERRFGGSAPMLLMIGVLGTVLLVMIGFAVWYFGFRSSDTSTTGSSDVVTVTSTRGGQSSPGGDPTGSPPTSTRSTEGSPPGGSTPVDVDRPMGNLDNVWIGPNTSAEFGRAVRDEVRDHWRRTGSIPPNVTATSPITGSSYRVDCVDQNTYVMCGGGTTSPPASVFIG